MATEAEQYLEDGDYFRRLVREGMTPFDIIELSGRDPEYLFSAIAFHGAKALHERAVTENWSRIRIVCELWILIARESAAMLGISGPPAFEWPADESPFQSPPDTSP